MPYVESPLDRIVNVQWGGAGWSLVVNFRIGLGFIGSGEFGFDVTSNITVPFPITYTNLRDIDGTEHEDFRAQSHTDYPMGTDQFGENVTGFANVGASVYWEQNRSFK